MNSRCGSIALFALVLAGTLVAAGGVARSEPLTEGIYYKYGNTMYVMAEDGSGKTELGALGMPSHKLHGGQRWMLVAKTVGTASDTYPDGKRHRQLFAVSEDGTQEVQLTSDTSVEFSRQVGLVDWAPGDSAASYVAHIWEYDTGTESWEVVEAGIYKLSITFDSDGDVEGASGDPVLVVASTAEEMETGEVAVDAELGYSWSPDGSKIVYSCWGGNFSSYDDIQIRIATVAQPSNSSLLVMGGRFPDWSANDLISYGTGLAIKVVNPDGTGNATLVDAPNKTDASKPRFSPDGTSLAYTVMKVEGKWNPVYTSWVFVTSVSNPRGIDLNTQIDLSSPIAWRGAGDPPAVTITQPADGSDVWGTITIKATVTDDGTIDQVEFFVDGTSIGTDTTSPYEIDWNSANVLDGAHTIFATATDDNDETGSDSVVVTVDNVDDPPEVAITDPEDGATVSGTSVTIAASAYDDGYVAKVEFFVGTTLIGTDTTAPYSVSWDSTSVSDGSHDISAKATDGAGKTDTDLITMTVDNTPASLTVVSISPDTVRAGKSVNVTVTGTGFASGASLTLENGSGPTVTVSNVSVVNSTTITANIAAASSSSKGTWFWDVVVTNSGGGSASLTDGFTVKR